MPPRRQHFLTEYEKAQDSAHAFDQHIWTITSIFWAGNFLLYGFAIHALSTGNTLLVRAVTSCLGLLGVLLVWLARTLALQFKALADCKFARCKELEWQFGFSQHRRTENVHPSGSQRRFYLAITWAFTLAWVVILALAWTLSSLGVEQAETHLQSLGPDRSPPRIQTESVPPGLAPASEELQTEPDTASEL